MLNVNIEDFRFTKYLKHCKANRKGERKDIKEIGVIGRGGCVVAGVGVLLLLV